MKLKTILLAVAAILSALPINAEGVTVGAERLDQYLPLLKGKRVAIYTNHTGLINGRPTVDVLLENGVNVKTLFSPEHGIRGTEGAGEHVASGVDAKTGLPVVSLFGKNVTENMRRAMSGVDVVVTDIQDVGLRYYTYYITMLRLMNEAARSGKSFIVLDRPNPLGMMVDGPTLDMKYASGVGKLPIPTVHGMTLGELARMIVGEGWLDAGRQLDLTVIPCLGYTHATRYRLPVPPSPNLPNMKAVYLYPSLCYFEATPVSLGRGTDMPFQCYGHPKMQGPLAFTPRSCKAAPNPPQKGQLCHGEDLRALDDEDIIASGINLEYLIDAYDQLNLGDAFFTPFFENLMGRDDIRALISRGLPPAEIKATWAPDIQAFKTQRRPYLLYPE